MLFFISSAVSIIPFFVSSKISWAAKQMRGSQIPGTIPPLLSILSGPAKINPPQAAVSPTDPPIHRLPDLPPQPARLILFTYSDGTRPYRS